MKRVFVTGGFGFIGTHLTSRLLADGYEVRIYDLQDSWHDDCHDLLQLERAMIGYDTVVHLASNADIAAAANDPMIDFVEGTILTQNVCEAARRNKVETILYASGSGVYGDKLLDRPYSEADVLEATSPYGASKIAGEALISAYCHMFGMRGVAFRFANVVGPGQTHGVGFDFIRKLKTNPLQLDILGDGKQTKSYIAVSDVIDAVLLAEEKSTRTFDAFNVATNDELTVTEIAQMGCQVMQVKARFQYSGGDRGWPGDVPVVRLESDRIRWLGWRNKMTSRQAMQWALEAMR